MIRTCSLNDRNLPLFEGIWQSTETGNWREREKNNLWIESVNVELSFTAEVSTWLHDPRVVWRSATVSHIFVSAISNYIGIIEIDNANISFWNHSLGPWKEFQKKLVWLQLDVVQKYHYCDVAWGKEQSMEKKHWDGWIVSQLEAVIPYVV